MPKKRPLLGLSCLSLPLPGDLHNHLGSSIIFTSCFMRPIEWATFLKCRAGLGQCFSYWQIFSKFQPEKYDFYLHKGFFLGKMAQIYQILNKV